MNTKLKIKAAVLEKNFQPLKIKNIFLKDELKKNQILVQIYYSGICGSQIGEINKVKGKDNYLPHLLGHEGTGKIININKKFKSQFKIGEEVILHWQKSNGKNCVNPIYYDSYNKKVNAGWVTTFNNFAIVSENRLTKLPKDISKKEGVLFGCGLTTAYGALFNNININKIKKEKILLTGFGMIGQIMLKFISVLGVSDITVVENNYNKILLLKKNYKNVKIFTNTKFIKKEVFDIAFETTGLNKLIEYSYNNIINKGKLILIGVPSYDQKIRINTLGINYGKKIIGSYGGNINPKKDIPKIFKFVKKNKIKLKDFFSGPYKFEKINDILKKIQSGVIIKKPLIKFNIKN